MPTTNKGFDQQLNSSDGLGTYQTVADTVGFVPSLRVKDNVIQTICVAIGLVGGALTGLLLAPSMQADGYVGAMIGAVGGLIVATLLSGGVIMVLGWVRAAKKLK